MKEIEQKKSFSFKKFCSRCAIALLSLLITISSLPMHVSAELQLTGTDNNNFKVAPTGLMGNLDGRVRVTSMTVQGRRITWVVEYQTGIARQSFPYHDFAFPKEAIVSTTTIRRETRDNNGNWVFKDNLTEESYGNYPAGKIANRQLYGPTYVRGKLAEMSNVAGPLDTQPEAFKALHRVGDMSREPRLGYYFESQMNDNEIPHRYTISVDIQSGVDPYSVAFYAGFKPGRGQERYFTSYTNTGNTPTTVDNGSKQPLYLFKNTLIQTVDSNDSPNGTNKVHIARISDNDGIESIRVIMEDGSNGSLGYNVDTTGAAYGTTTAGVGEYSRALRVRDRKGREVDLFQGNDRYKTYIMDVNVSAGEITKDPGGALTDNQKTALRNEILNKVTVDPGNARAIIEETSNPKYKKVIVGDLPTSGWGNRVTVRVISDSNVYKDVQVVVNFKDLPTIGQYDISWKQASVAGRNDVGFSWDNNNKVLVYKYNVDDATNFDVNDVLKQLRATTKSTVNASRFDTRALDGNEKSYVEGPSNNFSNYTDRGPARLNGVKNVNYLDIVNPANLWGGRPVIKSSELNNSNPELRPLYQGTNRQKTNSVLVPAANGVSEFNLVDNSLGLLADTLKKQKVYVGTAPAITRGGTAANDTDGVDSTIPIYFIGYIPNQAPVIQKRNIVIWKTDNHDIRTNLKDTIQEQILPITDQDNPMTFNASNVSVIQDGTNTPILPNISFKITNNQVYMTGYANEHTRHTARFKVVDGIHTVVGPDIWLFVAEATGGDIVKNIGEQVTENEVLNRVTVSNLPDFDMSKVSKALLDGESLPAVNENKTVFVKVRYNDPTALNDQYKIVPVNIYYNVIDKTGNTSSPTPNGYVRITLRADNTKGQLTGNVNEKVYDVKIGTERSVIDRLVTITPNNNYQVANQKWKDSSNNDIPATITASNTYNAQFEQKIYVSENNGQMHDIFVWKIATDPAASNDTYRQMESVDSKVLPIKDKTTPATFSNVQFVGGNNTTLANVGHLSVVFDNAQNIVKLSGYADVAPGVNTRRITATDTAGNNFITNNFKVVVYDATVTPITKRFGETVTDQNILDAVTINYGNYPNDASTAANRVVNKEIIAATKPANLNEGTYVVKVKLTNVHGLVKVVDVPVSYNIINRGATTNEAVPNGYVRITLLAEQQKGSLTVSGQSVQTQIYDVKSGTPRNEVESLVSLTARPNWQVVTSQKWKDAQNADIPNTITATKTYTAQFEEIDKELYYTKNVEDIFLWRISENPDVSSDEYRRMESIKGYILPIKDRDNPATFTDAYFGWNDLGAQKAPYIGHLDIAYDKATNTVHLTGYADAAVGSYSRKIVAKDPHHTLTSTGVKIFVFDATATEIVRNVGEITTEEDIKNAVNVNTLPNENISDANRVVRKEVISKPTNLSEGIYVAKVKLTNVKGMVKIVDVPVRYTMIDRSNNPTETTPVGYVRITLRADANKGQLSVNNQNVAEKVYDVKAGTARSVIDQLVTITPNVNWEVATPQWQDDTNSDIPTTITATENNKVYNAQFREIDKAPYYDNNGNANEIDRYTDKILVWKGESINKELPIKDKDNASLDLTQTYFVGLDNENRSNLSNVTFTVNNKTEADKTVHQITMTGTATDNVGTYDRRLRVKDTAHNAVLTGVIKVSVMDATVTEVALPFGSVPTQQEIENAITILKDDGNLLPAEKIVNYTFDVNNIGQHNGVYGVPVTLSNISGQSKVVIVPITYIHKKVTITAKRPFRGASSINVSTNAEAGTTVRLVINEGKSDAVVLEQQVNDGGVAFNFNKPLKKGDIVKLVLVADPRKVTPPPLTFKIR